MPKKKVFKNKFLKGPSETRSTYEAEGESVSFEGSYHHQDSAAESQVSPPLNWCYSKSLRSPAKNQFDNSGEKYASCKCQMCANDRRCECKNASCGCTSPILDSFRDENEEGVARNHLPSSSKPTNASVLRNAAILLKENKQRQQQILTLLSASANYLDYEKYLDDLREAKEREDLRELEKKHLSGQLSYEEAILAKKRVLEDNAKKRAKYMEEKAALEEELEAFKQAELSKVKQTVKGINEQREKAKEEIKKTIQSRQKAAKALSKDLKEMLFKKMKERRKEIEKKIAAIRELKILQQIKKEELNSREEKMTKLLGASFEELRARLTLYKRHLREDLMKKKERIAKQKYRREMLKTAAEKFIEEVNHCRKEVKRLNEERTAKRNEEPNEGQANDVMSNVKKLIEDGELGALRAKLERARVNRQMFQIEIKKANVPH